MSLELIVGETLIPERSVQGFFSAPNLTPARKGQPFWCYCSTQIIKHSTIPTTTENDTKDHLRVYKMGLKMPILTTARSRQ